MRTDALVPLTRRAALTTASRARPRAARAWLTLLMLALMLSAPGAGFAQENGEDDDIGGPDAPRLIEPAQPERVVDMPGLGTAGQPGTANPTAIGTALDAPSESATEP